MRRLLLILLLVGVGCSREQELQIPSNEVSWQTLLSNAWKMEPQPFSSSKLFSSSSGPVSQTGYAPVKYGDLDHGTFLDVKKTAGGYEAVLAEADGAGVITWIQSANPVGELIVEVDGKRTVHDFRSFLLGKWLPVKTPFASKTAEGFNLHFPIVHQEHGRLSLRVKSREELGALFYQVAWNQLDTPKTIKAFDVGKIAESRAMLKQISNHWKNSRPKPFSMSVARNIQPDESEDMLWSIGRGRFSALEISARSKKELAGLYLDIFWDGEEEASVSCPLHMLCGVSPAFENVNSLPVTVRRARAVIRWPMLFNESARIHVRNTGPKEAVVGVQVAGELVPSVTERFCAKVSNHWKLPLDQLNILTLAEFPRVGRVVGCAIQVENHGPGWWGEGDPLIYLNEADLPAWRGTGTEDYFGFAWCSVSRFQHPLRGQVSPGILYRYHLLDTLPFTSGGRFDFEVTGMGDGVVDYSALVLWYEEIPPMKSVILSK